VLSSFKLAEEEGKKHLPTSISFIECSELRASSAARVHNLQHAAQ
jgi:hypothetical protein